MNGNLEFRYLPRFKWARFKPQCEIMLKIELKKPKRIPDKFHFGIYVIYLYLYIGPLDMHNFDMIYSLAYATINRNISHKLIAFFLQKKVKMKSTFK